jgi:hypothetical protein
LKLAIDHKFEFWGVDSKVHNKCSATLGTAAFEPDV